MFFENRPMLGYSFVYKCHLVALCNVPPNWNFCFRFSSISPISTCMLSELIVRYVRRSLLAIAEIHRYCIFSSGLVFMHIVENNHALSTFSLVVRRPVIFNFAWICRPAGWITSLSDPAIPMCVARFITCGAATVTADTLLVNKQRTHIDVDRLYGR